MTEIKIPEWLPANRREAFRCGWIAREAELQADASFDALALTRSEPAGELTDDELNDIADGTPWHGSPRQFGREVARAAITLDRSRRAPQVDDGERQPSGYAYRYQQFGSSVIRFNGGGEVNGSKPTEAIPYWLGYPPQPIPSAEGDVTDEETRDLADFAHDEHGNYLEWLDGELIAFGRRLIALDRSRRAPQVAENEKGLHGKYIIHRSRDGSPVDYPCFVLRLDGKDPAAMAAMRAYAEDPACPPELAGDLAVYCAMPAPVQPAEIAEDQREAVKTAVADAIGLDAYDCTRVWEAWSVGTMGEDDFVLIVEDDARVTEIADAAIAAMAHPVQPADGEVAELVEWLESQVAMYENAFQSKSGATRLRRAAALLQHLQPPQPVAVSERLPGPEDCDAEGRCWLCGKVEGDWRLINPGKSGVPQLKYCFSHWLPHNALPLPATPEAES